MIEQDIQLQKEKERAFFELAQRFRDASDPAEIDQLGDQLGSFILGESCRLLDVTLRCAV